MGTHRGSSEACSWGCRSWLLLKTPALRLQAQGQEWGPAPSPPRQLETEDSGGWPPPAAPGQRAHRGLCCRHEWPHSVQEESWVSLQGTWPLGLESRFHQDPLP